VKLAFSRRSNRKADEGSKRLDCNALLTRPLWWRAGLLREFTRQTSNKEERRKALLFATPRFGWARRRGLSGTKRSFVGAASEYC
jgi:hypothetical protein